MVARTDLTEPAIGSTGWGTTLNTNFNILDQALCDTVNVTLTSSTTSYTLASAGNIFKYARIIFQGNFPGTSTITVNLPANMTGMFIVSNAVTNSTTYSTRMAFNTVAAGSGNQIYVGYGESVLIYTDGVFVRPVQFGNQILAPSGSIMAFAGSYLPYTGATSFGPTPGVAWLRCDGTVLNRSDFPTLFLAIGTKYNTGGETSAQFRLPAITDNLAGMPAGASEKTYWLIKA